MADLGGFDANQVEPGRDFEAIPPDRYQAMIVESEWVENSSGNGRHLKLQMLVVAGPHEGHTLFDRLNLENPSEKAVQIARGTLSRICRALKVMTPKDSSELHNLPFIVRVDKEEYEPGKWSNRVRGYYPVEEKNGAVQKKEEKTPEKKAASAPWGKK